MTEEKVNRRTGRINRQGEKILDSIQRENFTYLVVESNGGMPCPACCFQPCSIKPADLEPCVCFKNKYGKNIYYKKILNPIKPCDTTTKSTSPEKSRATTATKPNSKQPKRSSTKRASGAATPITTNAEVVSSTTATGVPPAESATCSHSNSK